MRPNLSLKFLEGVTEKLREENSDLKKEVDSLKGEVSSLQQELRTLSIIVSENIERREAVESSLVAVEQNCTNIRENQKMISSAVELQAQYSRKTTLLLTGKAIPDFVQGEVTRQTAVSVLKEYLGLEVHPRAIAACHRLSNKAIILVRFVDLDERMHVYRQRLSPKKRGLLIHESLTSERLAVIKILQKLHRPRETSPFVSYYTNMGRIFVRIADPAKAGSIKTLELPVGVTEMEILDICGRERSRAGRGGGLARPARPGPPAPGAPGRRGAAAPGAAARGGAVPGAAAPGAAAPGAAAPGAAAPGAAVPGAVVPGAAVPGAAVPGAAAPGAAAPGAAAPGAAAPGAAAPGAAAPGAAAPGAAAPGAAAPGAAAPGAAAPGSAAPGAAVPGAGAPGAAAPGAAAPGADVPGDVAPGADGPGAAAPDVGLPGAVALGRVGSGASGPGGVPCDAGGTGGACL